MDCDGAKGCEHYWVDSPGIVKEITRDSLNESLIVWGERWGHVSVFGVLSCCTIDWFDVWVGLVLGFARLGVGEAFESACDVCEHGHVNFAVFVVPV